ncbi:nidogen-1-like isoform X2 [Ostrea edulis]|nr:nidogen-1-like isoform X2 [Ostrea edulis]
MFNIGQLNGGGIREPSFGTEETGVVIFEPTLGSETCTEGATECDLNAQCVDYSIGYCCKCLDNYYGNGLNCLEKGVPQRMNGKVYGELNGYTIENLDMHVYIVTRDGRAYTAISRIVPQMEGNLRSLITVGGIMGWLFAQPQHPDAKNGYMLSGGILNRTAAVRYSTGEQVSIIQKFHGHDTQGHMRLETNIQGTVPSIPINSSITLGDYTEEYQRIAPGQWQSSSTGRYVVNGITRQYQLDQTIMYEECKYNTDPQVDVMRLMTSRNYLSYEVDQNIVRYIMTAKMGVSQSGLDPCLEGAARCHQNAECIPEGNEVRCQCRRGFIGDGTECQDVNECTENPCDVNADCYNLPGSFECTCRFGFTGDGLRCQREVRLCGDDVCNPNARCVFNSDIGRPMCECNSGYYGDGKNCSTLAFECNEAPDVCHQDAECVFDYNDRRYKCECGEGFSGDGLVCEAYKDQCSRCHINATCVFNVNTFAHICQCNPGFTGDGRFCSAIEIPSVCQLCSVNAECLFDVSKQNFTCQCRSTYRGDGFNCTQADCRYEQMCDPNADCLYDPFELRYLCLCRNGYSGNGLTCEPQGCEVYNDCDVNAQCLPDPRYTSRYACRCNQGYRGDGKSCEQEEVSCNQINNCSPFAECLYNLSVDSYRCRCRPGYDGDGKACIPSGHNCQRNPTVCDPNANCVSNGELYVCVCNSGFRGDGKLCYRTSSEDFLYLSQGKTLSRVNMDQDTGPGELIIYKPNQLIVAVDGDCADGSLYYTDVVEGSVYHAASNGSNLNVIISGLKSPEGLSIDWVSRNMYWTDSEMDCIEVSRLNGTSRKRLFEKGLVNPRAIVVNPQRGRMYWTDWNRGSPKIEVADMDGTNRKVFVESDMRLPNGLAIDLYSSQLCWGDAGTRKVECIREDGAGRVVLTDSAPYPFGLSYHGNNVYWTDWSQKSIMDVRQGGTPQSSLEIPVGGNGRLYGIASVSSCPRINNACSLNNGGCVYLCLPTPNGGRTCSCPDDISEEKCNEISVIRKKK